MVKFGIADYGMNVWDGGSFDIEARWEALRAIGYDGIERLSVTSAEEALTKAARMRKAGMDFATCVAPTPELSLQWTAGLGKAYQWTSVNGKEFATFCRQVDHQVAVSARWGVRVGIHNHLGTLVETQPQLEEFLARCPGCGLVLDTAHLAAAGGDPVDIVRRYGDRLVAVHLKDWLLLKPEIGFDTWWERGRFCGLGAGNIGLDNIAVMRAVVDSGYHGWVFVEHDTHLQDPLQDLASSRQYLKNAGY
ncbi:MAG TPA: sugar phosphate isomerase/epimerase [Armatimonadota bacterium]|jgi:sugar phosphate isomerase/epimerase